MFLLSAKILCFNMLFFSGLVFCFCFIGSAWSYILGFVLGFLALFWLFYDVFWAWFSGRFYLVFSCVFLGLVLGFFALVLAVL